MSTWVVVILALILGIVVGVVIWLVWRQSRNTPPVTTVTRRVDFGSVCDGVTAVCRSGLTCSRASPQDQQGICLRPLGAACNALSECVEEATVCNGVCSQLVTGGLNEACPCTEPRTQSVIIDGLCFCKGQNGHVCTVDSDCANGRCQGGVCVPLQQLGQACRPGQCDEGLSCSSGFCQPVGIATGTQGAYCEVEQPWPPQLGQTKPGCVESLSCLNQMCVPVTNQLGGLCAETQACQPPYVCLDRQCQYPDNPNRCDQTNTCIAGYSCTDGICLADSGQACQDDQQCMSGLCSQQGRILRWDHENQNWSVDSTPNFAVSRLLHYNNVLMAASIIGQAGTDGFYVYRNRSWSQIPKTGMWSDTNRSYRLIDAASSQAGLFAIYHVVEMNDGTSTNIGHVIYRLQPNTNWTAITMTPMNTASGVQVDNQGHPLVLVSLDVSETGLMLLGGAPIGHTNQYLYALDPSAAGGQPVTLLLNGEPCARGQSTTNPKDLCQARYYQMAAIPGDQRKDQFAYLDQSDTQRLVRFSGLLSSAHLPNKEHAWVTNYSLKIPNGQREKIHVMVLARDALNTSEPAHAYLIDPSRPGALYRIPGYFNEESRVLVTEEGDVYVYTNKICV